MEKNYLLSNVSRSFASAINEREHEMAVLFVEICNFFGMTITQPEQTSIGPNSSLKELDYLLAISG